MLSDIDNTRRFLTPVTTYTPSESSILQTQQTVTVVQATVNTGHHHMHCSNVLPHNTNHSNLSSHNTDHSNVLPHSTHHSNVLPHNTNHSNVLPHNTNHSNLLSLKSNKYEISYYVLDIVGVEVSGDGLLVPVVERGVTCISSLTAGGCVLWIQCDLQIIIVMVTAFILLNRINRCVR